MRYFIVFYVGVDSNNRVNHGSVDWTGEKYPNLKETIKFLKEDWGLKSAITNIIELSKDDFDEFKR